MRVKTSGWASFESEIGFKSKIADFITDMVAAEERRLAAKNGAAAER